jgi:hypothetical protein
MKFAEHLGAHITPEWRKQCEFYNIYGFTNGFIDKFLFSDIQYEEMKAKLVMCIQEAPSPESVEPDHLTRYFAKFDEAFFTFCEKGES